jgi:hypothetical protein
MKELSSYYYTKAQEKYLAQFDDIGYFEPKRSAIKGAFDQVQLLQITTSSFQKKSDASKQERA